MYWWKLPMQHLTMYYVFLFEVARIIDLYFLTRTIMTYIYGPKYIEDLFIWQKILCTNISLTLYVPGGQICLPLCKLQFILKFRFTNPYWDLLTFCTCPLRSFYKKLEHPMCLSLILADFLSDNSFVSE